MTVLYEGAQYDSREQIYALMAADYTRQTGAQPNQDVVNSINAALLNATDIIPDAGGHYAWEQVGESSLPSWIPYTNPLENALDHYKENDGFRVADVAAMIRGLNNKYKLGYTDDQLAYGVIFFGNFHRQQFNSGYTNASNYNLIALHAIVDYLSLAGDHEYARDIVLREYPQIQAGAVAAANRWLKDESGDRDLLGDMVKTAIMAIAAYTLGPAAWASLGETWASLTATVTDAASADFFAQRAAEAQFFTQQAAEVSVSAVPSTAQIAQQAITTVAQTAIPEAAPAAVDWNAIASGYENAVATSAVQNAVIAEGTGQLAAGTVVGTIGAEAATVAFNQAVAAGLVTAEAAAVSLSAVPIPPALPASLTAPVTSAVSLPAIPAGAASALIPLLRGVLSAGATPVPNQPGMYRLPDGRVVPYGAVDGSGILGDNKNLLLMAGAGLLAFAIIKPSKGTRRHA